jgi:hypothetical protein
MMPALLNRCRFPKAAFPTADFAAAAFAIMAAARLPWFQTEKRFPMVPWLLAARMLMAIPLPQIVLAMAVVPHHQTQRLAISGQTIRQRTCWQIRHPLRSHPSADALQRVELLETERVKGAVVEPERPAP